MATMLAATAAARAHIVTETPWHPIAASYRTMMFLGDLKPVPWGKIRSAFETPLAGAYGSKSAREKLIALDAASGKSASAAILRAIEIKDRQALYAAATRALSQTLRRHLELATENLNNPSIAIRNIETAQALYRAVRDFIQRSDAVNYRKLGRAWLTMTSSIGSAGVLGNGAIAPDKARFDAARNVIDQYLAAEFEPAHFTPRNQLTPIPEHVIASGRKVDIAPWLPPGSDINDQDPLPLLILNFEARGVDETKIPLVAYGDMLFDSPEVFGPVARSLGISCSTCHNRSDINKRFFIPGVSHQAGAADVDGGFFNPEFNDHRADSIDIPSLRGIRFTAPYGRDGRIQGLRNFTRNVIVSEFGGKEPTPFMLDALIAYMLEFDFLPNSNIGSMGALKPNVTQAARRGEALFNKPFAGMAGKSCASCHIPSANFVDKRQHNIGSERQDYKNSRGGAYDTPTLLGTKFTAPYFHDGALPTLASVVNWFDGKFSLGLNKQQQSDLTAYLETVGGADEPYEVFSGRNTPFRLGFDELMTFVSTLDVLLPKRDRRHTALLLRTVTTDLKADASGMANLQAKAKAYELAAQLGNISKAVANNNWPKAEREWSAFKTAKEEYDKAMY